jgi:hypothetical protein
MADRPSVKTRPITRDKLAQFLPSFELIKAFEAMTQDITETLPDAIAQGSEEVTTVLSAEVFRHRDPVPSPLQQQPVDASTALSLMAFSPRPQAAPLSRDDDMSRLIANQIFGG